MLKKRDRSDDSHAILDSASRKRKADKILRVLDQKTVLSSAKVLDIGTGSGYMPHHFGKKAKEVTSVDLVDERRIKDGYKFKRVKDETLPFEDGAFDVVISNHVIEHVKDQQRHVDEVFRVLKGGGTVYLATPNRYWITDPHYRIPFINWMPRRVASMYLKLLQKKNWDISPITHKYLKKLAKRENDVELIVADIIKYPEQYRLDAFKNFHPLTRRMPKFILKFLSQLSPTLIVVMKNNQEVDFTTGS